MDNRFSRHPLTIVRAGVLGCCGIAALLLASGKVAIADPTPPATTGKVLLDTDFGDPNLKLNEVKSERTSGQLPDGWRDNSSWAKVTVNYEPKTAEQPNYQRITVSALESGRAQMLHNLLDVTAETVHLLEVAVRNTTATPISFGLRQQGTPWQYSWETKVKPSPEWQNIRLFFEVKPNTQPIGFYFAADSVGNVDLDYIRLREVSRTEVASIVKEKYPAGSPRNLLAATRFPLGLPTGWTLVVSPDFSVERAVKVEADATVPGPSRSPALKVEAARPLQLHGALFDAPFVTSPHVASFWARGQGRGKFSVMAGPRRLATTAFTLSGTEWQRFELPFTPILTGANYAPVFDIETGTLWLDALQVEVGDKASTYAPQKTAEVALSNPSATGVQFADEADAKVNWSVTGAPAGALLKFRIVNLYGETATPKVVKLGGEFLQSGHLNYAVFPQHPLGSFRVEAQVEDAQGQLLSAPSEVVVHRVRRPRYWMKDAPDSAFGTHIRADSRDILLSKSLGLNWTRLHDAGVQYMGWRFIEPERGQWKFRDAEIHNFRKYGMKVLGVLGTSPDWATNIQKPHSTYFDRYYMPKNFDDFAQYSAAVAARYKGVVDDYEVWNEPWSTGWWHDSYDETDTNTNPQYSPYRATANPQAEYARLTKAAYDAVKAVDKSITLVGFNTTSAPPHSRSTGGAAWTRGVLENGGLQSCDVISYHEYLSAKTPLGAPGDEIERGVQVATTSLPREAGRLPKPLWYSEGNPVASLGRGSGFYRYTLPYPNTDNIEQVSNVVCRNTISLLGQNVQKIFLYTMETRSSFGNNDDWSVLLNHDYSLHPSGVAYSNLTWLLEDTKFVKRIALNAGVYAYLFQGDKRSVAAILPQPGSQFTIGNAGKISWVDMWGNALVGGAKIGEETLAYAESKGTVADLEATLVATAKGS